MNLSDISTFKAEFLSLAISDRLWFDSWLRHNAFRKSGCELSDFPIVL